VNQINQEAAPVGGLLIVCHRERHREYQTMGRISIEAYHYEPKSHALTSLNFTVQFPEGEALVSILDMRPLSLAEEEDGIRALLLHLAEGITSAVQSPQGITSAPQSRG
jgi:hypothetical protein